MGAQVAAHAAVLVVMPPLARDAAPAKAAVLEILILQPEPLPVAVPEPVAQPPVASQPERAPASAKGFAKPASAQPAPPLAVSDSAPAAEGSFSVTPPGVPEPPVAASRHNPAVASVSSKPTSVSAAYLSNPAPRYPSAARRAGEQGTVTLRVLVTREGLPTRIDVEKSSGSLHLDAAALEAVKAWRFVPARQGADAVESWMLVPIVFRLEAAS